MIAVGAWVALAAPRGVDFGVPPPAGLERAYASRRVALVVGIDAYHDPALGNLAFAAKDATDLAAVLRDPELGDYDQVSVLAGEVSAAAFWDGFHALASEIQRDDTVMVYVAESRDPRSSAPPAPSCSSSRPTRGSRTPGRPGSGSTSSPPRCPRSRRVGR